MKEVQPVLIQQAIKIIVKVGCRAELKSNYLRNKLIKKLVDMQYIGYIILIMKNLYNIKD